MDWSAAQYRKFEQERNRPIHDLIAQIPVEHVARAADIGCGPGNSTELLQARFPEAEVVGMDSSADMIAAARKRLPGVHFEIADIATWADPGPFDVILANAVLQWVPDHEALFLFLAGKLAEGGRLGVQMPDNLAQPTHVLMREVAAGGPWAHKLAKASQARTDRHDATWYYRLLQDHVGMVDIWRTTYHHPLAGAAAVVEWFKGSALRPFLDPLDEDERAEFLARFQAGIERAYPVLPNGVVVLPFPRLFIVATR